jgi:hypothetical protein
LLKYQTFRIRQFTNFKTLKDVCLSLWDLKERDSEFNIKFIDNDKISNIDNENFIDAFLKSKSNIKYAKFALMNKNSRASNLLINYRIRGS